MNKENVHMLMCFSFAVRLVEIAGDNRSHSFLTLFYKLWVIVDNFKRSWTLLKILRLNYFCVTFAYF